MKVFAARASGVSPQESVQSPGFAEEAIAEEGEAETSAAAASPTDVVGDKLPPRLSRHRSPPRNQILATHLTEELAYWQGEFLYGSHNNQWQIYVGFHSPRRPPRGRSHFPRPRQGPFAPPP